MDLMYLFLSNWFFFKHNIFLAERNNATAKNNDVFSLLHCLFLIKKNQSDIIPINYG